MIVSRTPFRISFFGGGTDYPSWYREHGGAVLATTIDKYCYLTCRYLPPFFEHRYRLVYSKIENCHTIEAITHPAAREVLRFMQMERGVEIHHDGDLPARSGMGSSSAFTVGLVHALYALKGRMPSKHQLAMESIRIEQEMVKETVGSQDQVMAAYGGLSQVSFHANGEITVRPLALAYDRIRELNANLMLFYTGIKRTAAEVANSYVHQIGDKKKQLHRLREMVDESIAILNNGDDLTAFGELLHESWQAKRSLSAHVTNSDVNDIYEAARAAGARGGKLIGAGGGGFMLLFVPPSRQDAVRQRLNKLLHVPFEFEFNGSQIIFLSHEVDYTAAENARANQSLRAFRELTAPQS